MSWFFRKLKREDEIRSAYAEGRQAGAIAFIMGSMDSHSFHYESDFGTITVTADLSSIPEGWRAKAREQVRQDLQESDRKYGYR